LRCIRLHDVYAPATLASPGRGSAHNFGCLEFFDLQPAGVREPLDESGM
jgi:hypothetical protein